MKYGCSTWFCLLLTTWVTIILLKNDKGKDGPTLAFFAFALVYICIGIIGGVLIRILELYLSSC